MEFFDFTVERGDSLGFGLFTWRHGLYGAFCVAGIAALCFAYKRADGARRRLLRRSVGAGTAGLELLRALLLMAAGQYGLGHLPLHLCTMAAYILLLHSLRGGRITGQFLYAFCMPGALTAILLPDWHYYPALHFMSFCGFVLHMLIAGYVLMLFAGGDLIPEPRALPACLRTMLTLALPVYVFDRLTGTNYMFLNWPPEGTPLTYFAALGRPGYLLGFLPMIAAVWVLLYGPLFLRQNRKGRDTV